MTGLYENGVVELYGYRFRLSAPPQIQESLVSTFPGKIVIGDTRRVDDPVASSYVMQDWTGGGLKWWMDPTVDIDRFYWSTCATWYTRQLTLNGLPRFSAQPVWGDGVQRNVRSGALYNTRQYIGYDEYLCYLDANEVVQSVGTVASAGNVVTGMKVYRHLTGASAGASVLVISYINSATGVSGYAYYDGTTIHAGTGTMAASVIWDGKLVKCDDTGALLYQTDATSTTWTPLPGQNVVPLTEGSVTNMNSYPDGFWGLDEIQIATTTGLFWYDEIAQLVRKSRLADMPSMPSAGRPLVNHKSNLYIPAPATQVLRYTGDTVSPEGLDRDDGLPNNFRGQITWLASTLNFLVAATMSTQLSANAPIRGGDAITYASTMAGTSGQAALWIQTRVGGGWHNIYNSPTAGTSIYWVGASNADSKYRLFFGDNGKVGIIDLYDDLANPLSNTIQQFATTGQHVTPWNEMGWSEVEKLLLRQDFGTKGTGILASGATCTTAVRPACNIVVEYAKDYDEVNWSTLTTVTTGPTPPSVAYGTNGLGLPVKAVRFRFTLNRCDNPAHTPVLVWSTLAFLKVQDARWGYEMSLDLTTSEQGRTPADSAALLRRMADPKDLGATMGVFRGWVDGKFVARNVKVSELVGVVNGGNVQTSTYRVSLVAF